MTTFDIGDDYDESDPNRPCVAVFSDPSGASRAYIFESLTEASVYVEGVRRDVAKMADGAESGWDDLPVAVVPIYGVPGAWVQGSQVESSA